MHKSTKMSVVNMTVDCTYIFKYLVLLTNITINTFNLVKMCTNELLLQLWACCAFLK